MRILPPVEEEIRRTVRDERAKDPLVTVSGLKAAFEKHFERGFSHQYVSKISDKVAREGLVEADRTRIEDRMNFTRENYRMMLKPKQPSTTTLSKTATSAKPCKSAATS